MHTVINVRAHITNQCTQVKNMICLMTFRYQALERPRVQGLNVGNWGGIVSLFYK